MKALPLETVRLLSSSQVITCVLNVVKELIENSLDASSSRIEVKLENYGLDRIEVRDDGCGIKTADVPAMALKHYTSKISCHEDLEHLNTYGFRGEALASICAISEVVVTTRTADDDVSTQYTLDLNGHIVSKRPSHLGQGTTVCVMRLFKNLPVRRQYYSSSKKCKEELKKVQDLLMAYAIIKPELRITLTHNKAMFWQKAKVSDHRAALVAVLGAASVASLLPFQHRQEQPQIAIEGYFPKPDSDLNSTSSSTSDKTFIYVNNRPVHHKDILKLVKQYYAKAAHANSDSASHRFPILMMNITVPASSVDVNLTPDKVQVLLENKDAVLLAVESVLISLYGSYSVGNDVHISGGGQHCSKLARQTLLVGESKTSHDGIPIEGVAQSSSEYCIVPSSAMLEHSITDKQPQASETSLPGTANTSSSSSSEDWIINKSLSEFDTTTNFSSFVDNVVLNSTTDQERSSKKDSALAQGDEISPERWSAGTALRDPATGRCLEPVKLHTPELRGDDAAMLEPKSSSPPKRPSNIITAKMAEPTAYDLLGNRAVRQPLSALTLFERDTRSSILLENPRASLQDVTSAVKERWECLGEEERKKYEEKAQKSMESYNLKKKQAAVTDAPGWADERPSTSRPQGLKRKAPLSNQQILDRLFSSQQERREPPAKLCRPLPFSIDALRRAPQHNGPAGPSSRGLRLVNCLASHCAWAVLCGRKLMLLNPFRVEEALLFKRLLENNILPVASLQTPIQLTDGVLGGAEYMDVLMSMEKGSPSVSGEVQFTDPRLVANGFQIRLTPGFPPTGRCVEVTGMADCMPFYGITDLREILTAVKDSGAKAVQQCRPLKAANYLEGEAVRLARQLPFSLSREDVNNILFRMNQELEEKQQVCLHGRPFFYDLVDVPETEQETLKIKSST
ncbi:PMS1 protein homolog 1 isoform X1 [Electrophorus electricus]|uniref:PMS1 protein homolog 1 isoform X1 n=2 Tax=Electrophorus electricus TaxID=8005 RepID=UPI0015D0B5E7|nr:PMS1 protein homolog 1 isoform X1 [Electrophorus electricus]